MLLNTDQITNIDDIKINFDSSGLWVLNIAIGIIMFGVALGITTEDFKRLFKNPKIVFVGVLSQFILLPAATFLAILIIKPHPSFALGMMKSKILGMQSLKPLSLMYTLHGYIHLEMEMVEQVDYLCGYSVVM
mgnify:CR=1 FL=1